MVHGVVTPHASFLALRYAPREAIANLRALISQFPIYSPLVDSVEVIRRGKVRRAKLYYLRGRRGKAARIAERQRGTAEVESDTAAAEAAKA